ncbi:MAG: aspartate 1-decarboxylase [Dehalococcoidia bacterium]|nr:aspartate 1-decarboxylase [Dehalococcoidia bacterium]
MRMMLKSKIHRARVTDVNLEYEGSITIDGELLQAADILPYEQVQVVNVNNGARFETYAIEGDKGSGVIAVNGAAARLVAKADTVIIFSYHPMPDEEARQHHPKLVYVDKENRLARLGSEIKALSWVL